MMHNILTACAALCVMATVLSAGEDPTADFINRFDRLYKSTSSRGEMEVKIVTEHWTRTLKMRTWSRGQELMLIKVLAPKRERNMGTLKYKNRMWNYMPKTNKIMKIPPSMMMGSWMGSDLTNDDITGEYTLREDYEISLMKSDSLYNYFTCTPRPGTPIIWGKLIITARKEDHIPVKQEYYDEQGARVRVMHFRDITEFDGRRIPAVMELIPLTEEESKTVVRYIDMEFGVDIPDSRFSLKALREPVEE
ncbi:MAG: outer membrane lipoprotein-sorting protein [Fibrobacterota bacterium]